MMNADDLQPFCCEADDIRYYLCKPWSRGEFTYATNGHIILRVARVEGVEEQPKAPDAVALFAEVAPANNWMPVPAQTMPPDIECDECGGAGIYEVEGQRETYEKDCEFCNHTGKVKARIGVEFAGTSFDQGYLSMLQGWEISPDGQKPAWIRNGDTLGLLMPRRMP